MTPLLFALKHNLKPSEFMAFEMIKKFTREYDVIKQYEKVVFQPSKEDMQTLMDKELIISSSQLNPAINNSIVNPNIRQLEIESGEDMATELWEKYPAALPLGDGGMFIARKGPDKQEVLKLYLERINFNPEKHKFVLEQLKKYVKLVHDRKINGHRIHDWISNEMWDIIPELEAASRGEFKTDI